MPKAVNSENTPADSKLRAVDNNASDATASGGSNDSKTSLQKNRDESDRMSRELSVQNSRIASVQAEKCVHNYSEDKWLRELFTDRVARLSERVQFAQKLLKSMDVMHQTMTQAAEVVSKQRNALEGTAAAQFASPDSELRQRAADTLDQFQHIVNSMGSLEIRAKSTIEQKQNDAKATIERLEEGVLQQVRDTRAVDAVNVDMSAAFDACDLSERDANPEIDDALQKLRELQKCVSNMELEYRSDLSADISDMRGTVQHVATTAVAQKCAEKIKNLTETSEVDRNEQELQNDQRLQEKLSKANLEHEIVERKIVHIGDLRSHSTTSANAGSNVCGHEIIRNSNV